MRRLRAAALAAVLVLTLGAQRRSERDGYERTPYDGRFTFARIRFEPMGGEGGGFRGRDLKWDHDYPRGERHFTRILDEVTAITPHLAESTILTLDDPDLMKFPIAFLCEPGFWTMTDAEKAGLRAYLMKGGFIVFDDFAGTHWYNFQEQLRSVFPELRPIPIDVSHPIFDSFFHITSLDFDHPYFGVKAQFLGLFEDNDPTKRMLAMINYNNDISEYWEWSDEGWLPIDLSNEAYKLGVNYVVYAMTH